MNKSKEKIGERWRKLKKSLKVVGGGTKELKRNQRKRLKMGIVKSLERIRVRRFGVEFKEKYFQHDLKRHLN